MYSTGRHRHREFVAMAAGHQLVEQLALLVDRQALAWAMTYLPSSIADRNSMSSVTRPFATFL